jgi:hypothetical protein
VGRNVTVNRNVYINRGGPGGLVVGEISFSYPFAIIR